MTDPQGFRSEHYLGDGLYVQCDGYQLMLRAPSLEGDHWVALEPAVYQELRRWINDYPALKAFLEGTAK